MLGNTVHTTYSETGQLPSLVLAFCDVGVGPSGSVVAGFNLLGLLKDFLSIR